MPFHTLTILYPILIFCLVIQSPILDTSYTFYLYKHRCCFRGNWMKCKICETNMRSTRKLGNFVVVICPKCGNQIVSRMGDWMKCMMTHSLEPETYNLMNILSIGHMCLLHSGHKCKHRCPCGFEWDVWLNERHITPFMAFSSSDNFRYCLAWSLGCRIPDLSFYYAHMVQFVL